MDFFNSLTLDLKIMVAAMAGVTLLAIFTGNQKTEKRYMVVFAVLVAASIYRYAQLPADDQARKSATTGPVPHSVPAVTKHRPLESTSAK
jgi:hypothetical protein